MFALKVTGVYSEIINMRQAVSSEKKVKITSGIIVFLFFLEEVCEKHWRI